MCLYLNHLEADYYAGLRKQDAILNNLETEVVSPA